MPSARPTHGLTINMLLFASYIQRSGTENTQFPSSWSYPKILACPTSHSHYLLWRSIDVLLVCALQKSVFEADSPEMYRELDAQNDLIIGYRPSVISRVLRRKVRYAHSHSNMTVMRLRAPTRKAI